MVKCSVYDSPATAKGLCQKHYMRLHRHGDTKTIHPRGPKSRDWFPGLEENSKRTLSTFSVVQKIFAEIAAGSPTDNYVELVETAIKEASRPNGSLNYAKLRRIADRALIEYVLRTRGSHTC